MFNLIYEFKHVFSGGLYFNFKSGISSSTDIVLLCVECKNEQQIMRIK